MQAPISSRFVLVFLLVCCTFASKIAADPPASYTSTSPAVPGVYGTNTANGDGVFGNATTGRGVVGASESGIGVQGNAKEGRGVVGISDTKAGIEGQSQSHVGVWGETRSPSGAGGEFHNNGGGDLIRAGLNGVFRVSNNGDVFVRGQMLGTAGPEGPPGPPGPPELLCVLWRCVAVGVVRANAIVLVVKLRVRLLALQPQDALRPQTLAHAVSQWEPSACVVSAHHRKVSPHCCPASIGVNMIPDSSLAWGLSASTVTSKLTSGTVRAVRGAVTTM